MIEIGDDYMIQTTSNWRGSAEALLQGGNGTLHSYSVFAPQELRLRLVASQWHLSPYLLGDHGCLHLLG